MEGGLYEAKMPLYCVVGCDQKCIEAMNYYGFYISLMFSGLTTLISLYNIFMHYINFNNPHFQSKIIIILLIPSVFSFISSFSFISFTLTTYLAIARSLYELVAVFAFFYLIFAYLGFDHQKSSIDEKKVYEIMRGQNSQIPHDFPYSYFQKPYQISNWRKAKYLSNRCKRFIVQYILAKIVAQIFLMIFETASGWNYYVPRLVQNGVYWIIAISSYIGYYYLRLFFNCLKISLKPFRPDMKFFIVTATVFFIFWQAVVFNIFSNNIVACFDQTATSFHKKQILQQFEHIIISIEMFFISFICSEAFSYEDYVIKERRKIGSIPFIIKDIVSLFFTQLKLIKPKSFGFSSNNDKSETQLHTITKHTKNNTKTNYICRINLKIDKNTKENYF